MPEQTPLSGRTAWIRRRERLVQRLLRSETGSALLLVAATLAALLWINLDQPSYEGFWRTRLAIDVGGMGVGQELRQWVNSGLMTFFFLVVGLRARREFDLGELRQRERVALPVLAGIGGMVAAIAIYLALNWGRPSAHGWGMVMSTDTAIALGLLALVGPSFRDRLAAFLLTVLVVDDVVAVATIATVYSQRVALRPLLVAILILALVPLAIRLRVRYGQVYFALGALAWVAASRSGVEPLVVGLVMGLMAYAYPADRGALERATDLFRSFREQPTPELARSVQVGVVRALSPNERLLRLYDPWTQFAILPLFALANAGIAVNGGLLARALTSPIVLGTVLGYVVGKPAGIIGISFLTGKLSRGRIRPPVGWAAVAGGGTLAGVGFTVALLIASLAFGGRRLDEAKVGILVAASLAAAITWVLFRVTARLPRRAKIRALVGTADPIVDLAMEVDPERDHVRGSDDAPVTLVEYGDFECPYCGQAEPVVRELLSDYGDVRYVWRHLPLTDVHPHAQTAAEASEAAAAQGAFWQLHDLMLARQEALLADDLVAYASELNLDVERFRDDLTGHAGAGRVAEDVDSADLSGVTGTPTFFVNGRRHYGAYDIDALSAAVRLAGAKATLTR